MSTARHVTVEGLSDQVMRLGATLKSLSLEIERVRLRVADLEQWTPTELVSAGKGKGKDRIDRWPTKKKDAGKTEGGKAGKEGRWEGDYRGAGRSQTSSNKGGTKDHHQKRTDDPEPD